MQNTRLTSLVNGFLGQFSRWLQNPWRRLSVIIISLLLGNFLAIAISSVAGQQGDLDVVVSVLLVAFTELVSWAVYKGDAFREARQRRRTGQQAELPPVRPLLFEMMNGFKLGLIYALFVEAFKLGS